MRARQESFRSSRTERQWTTARQKPTEILSEPEVTAIADVKMGAEEAAAWGCDLTHEYVALMQITKLKHVSEKRVICRIKKMRQKDWRENMNQTSSNILIKQKF